jgi:hypothetical protein
MNKEFKFKMPIYMILLDIFGATLAALGLLEWFTDMSFVPDQFKLEYYYIAMVIIGVLFMVPMHLHIYKFATRKNTSDTY